MVFVGGFPGVWSEVDGDGYGREGLREEGSKRGIPVIRRTTGEIWFENVILFLNYIGISA